MIYARYPSALYTWQTEYLWYHSRESVSRYVNIKKSQQFHKSTPERNCVNLKKGYYSDYKPGNMGHISGVSSSPANIKVWLIHASVYF